MRRTLGIFCVALLAAPLYGCPQSGGHVAPGRSKVATSAAAGQSAVAVTEDKVLVSTLPSVPGHTIVATEGFSCRSFLWDGSGNYVEKFEGALYAFRVEAAKHDADAVVNLRISAIPFARKDATGGGSVVNLCGDDVKLR